jgi:hypothetical protein
VFILQTKSKEHSMFSKTQKTGLKWIQDKKLFKIQLTVCGNFLQGAGTPGTERVITFSQLAVKE